MKSLIKLLFISTSLLLATGCASTMKVTKLDNSGYFKTNSTIFKSGIEVAEEFKSEYGALLFVKTDEKNEKYNEFFIESFRNMDKFQNVTNKSELETMVLEKELTGKVSNISDKIGLHSLSEQIGQFLVVEPYVEWKGGYNFAASLVAFDPTTGKDVLVLKHEAFNWAGLDQPLFYPLFNAFLEWSRGQKITTKKKPEANSDPSQPRT